MREPRTVPSGVVVSRAPNTDRAERSCRAAHTGLRCRAAGLSGDHSRRGDRHQWQSPWARCFIVFTPPPKHRHSDTDDHNHEPSMAGRCEPRAAARQPAACNTQRRHRRGRIREWARDRRRDGFLGALVGVVREPTCAHCATASRADVVPLLTGTGQSRSWHATKATPDPELDRRLAHRDGRDPRPCAPASKERRGADHHGQSAACC